MILLIHEDPAWREAFRKALIKVGQQSIIEAATISTAEPYVVFHKLTHIITGIRVSYNNGNAAVNCEPIFNFVCWLSANGFSGKIVLTHCYLLDDSESRIRKLRLLANVTVADSYNFVQYAHLFL